MHNYFMYYCNMDRNKEFLSGTLTSLILSLLDNHGRMYGYEICQKAKELSSGEINLTEGAIYPALHRLEKKGIVESSKEKVNGRVRKYYSIKKEQEIAARQKINSLLHFMQNINGILTAEK